MNRLLVTSCFNMVLTLSAADAGRSSSDSRPNLLRAGCLSPARFRVKLPIRLFWNYLVMVEGSIGNVQ